MIGTVRGFREGLAKTRKSIAEKLGELVLGDKINELFLDELEYALISSDVGAKTTALVLGDLKDRFKRSELNSSDQVRDRLRVVLAEALQPGAAALDVSASPAVILVIGVNGTGKTTTIGKLAHRLKGEGKKVLLAAADTFRAAASDQLAVWGERAGIPVIKHGEGADPGAVVYDALAAARARMTDVVLVDTAGRLHTKSNLMEELKKVRRIISREVPAGPHETLLVLDATTGQNALVQAKMFHDAVGVTGIVLTKLDGSAKGGIVFAISRELSLPVKFVGIGEAIEDLRPFSAAEFAEAFI